MSGEDDDKMEAEDVGKDEENLLNVKDTHITTNAELNGTSEENTVDAKQSKGGLSRAILRIKNDNPFRQRIIHTAILCWSFIGLGWSAGMNGPVFPDLRQIIGEDLATSSWMFTVGSFGYLAGSLLGGILYDKLDKVLLLTASTLGSGVCTLFTPYCSTLPWMLFIKFAGGFFFGGLDTGGNADIIHVWGRDVDVYMQALHFAFSFGALLSPLATEPFLADKRTVCDGLNLTHANTSTKMSLTTQQTTYLPATSPDFNNVTSANGTQLLKCADSLEETNVHFAFLNSAIFMFLATIGYIYLYIKVKKNKKKLTISHTDTQTTSELIDKRMELSISLKVVFLILLSMLIALYCVAEDSFAGFLMTFSIDYLNWDKSNGSFATALFWFSFSAGRFFGIFIVSCCKNSSLLTTYLFLLCFSYIGFCLATLFKFYPFIWLFIAVLGFSLSVIFPAIFSWTSEHLVHISGKISGLFLTSSCLSGMVFPLLIGYLMEYFHPMWYSYILLIISISCLSLYICIRIVRRCCLRMQRQSKEEEMKVDVEMTLVKS